ncbi:hypothetical protein QYF36_022283 [Acer negundo]|nr:hypothetical protein QYF36_022283 [Acer negundo]
MLSYEVNAVGPILVIKHIWPLLKVGGGTGTERDVAVVANLSARVGSIGDGTHIDHQKLHLISRNVPEGKLFTKEFSVQKLLGIINKAKWHDNGKFFAWDGQEIPC